jgi:ABC-type sugar transport system substrate-binding protein
MNAGAQAEATKLHVDLIWQGNPSQYSPSTQIPVVQQVTTQLASAKPSALVLGPTDPKALEPYVKVAVKKHIPVFNVDSQDASLKNITGFVTGNNAQGGQAAADALAGAMGYTAGKTYNVVVGMTSPTATTNVLRYDGFKAEIAKKYPGIKILAEAYSQSSPTTANTNIQNWLTEYSQSSKTPLNGIFAIDGTNAEGAASALQAGGLACSKTVCGSGHVALVGYDAYSSNVSLLSSGVFAALIAQDPYQEGIDSVFNAYTYLKTGKLPKGVSKTTTLPNVTLLSTSNSTFLAKYTYATA